MRRFSLHTLKDFGFGKSVLEDIIEEEIDNLFEYIDNHYLNEPIDVIRSLKLLDLNTALKWMRGIIRFLFILHNFILAII